MKNKLLTTLVLTAASLSIANPQSELQSLFAKRISIRASANMANKDVVKNTLQQIRDQEELLGEQINEFKNKSLKIKSADAFSSSYLLNPKFSTLEFKSGDVVVLRGVSALSAVVSNITDTPSSYSHTLIIYIDPKSQKKYGVEALIDSGVVAHPLEKVLSEGVPRVMIYRQTDAVLANKAAEVAFQIANPGLTGKKLGYDLKLNLGDYSAVYCSEFVRMVYDLASSHTIVLPTFPSSIGGKFPNIQKALGLNVGRFLVYAPLDIDLEPSFELVAEWRDFSSTVNYRIKDSIVKAVLTWLETQKDKFRSANTVYQQTQILQDAASSTTPGSVAAAKPNAGSGMVPKVLSALTKVLNLETNVFIQMNNEFLALNKRNMTNTEIQTAIARSSLLKMAQITFTQFEVLKP